MGRRIITIISLIAFICGALVVITGCEDIALRNLLVDRILGWKSSVVLIGPVNEGTVAERTPLLEWEHAGGAVNYHIKIAETELLLADAEVLETEEPLYEMPGPVTIGDNYFWQVCAVSGEGETGEWSEVWNFSVIPSPTPVRLESTVIDTVSGGYNLMIKDNYAYVCANTAGLYIINISDPENPNVAKKLTTLPASDIEIQDNYAFINNEDDNLLHILDISNPENPVEKVMFPRTEGGTNYTCLFMDNLYCIGNDYVEIIDVSSILVPEYRETISPIDGDGGTGHLWDIEWDGLTNAVVSENLYGIHILSTEGLKSSLPIPGYGEYCQIDIKDGYAYAGSGSSGLKIVDISNPYFPTVAATYETEGSCLAANISGNFCFISDGNLMKIIDISDPVSPVEISSAEGLWCYDARGNYGFSVDYFNHTFYVIDLLPVP